MVLLIVKNVFNFQSDSLAVCFCVSFAISCLEYSVVSAHSKDLRSKTGKAPPLGWQLQLHFEVAPVIFLKNYL